MVRGRRRGRAQSARGGQGGGPSRRGSRPASHAKIRAAFQGERGAFSEEAARRFLGPRFEPLPEREFDDMFDAVVRGDADCAVVPVENTLAGSVIKNYDLLVSHDLTIIGEVVLRVAHNLIAPRGVKLSDVRRVFSHPVALAQCEDYLRKLRQRIPSLEVLPAYDTAGAVKMVVKNRRHDEAAIASKSAAEVFAAHILASGIESNPQNFTRFFVMARPDRVARIPVAGKAKERKTSLVFRIANRPGSLYASLYAFAAEQVDLTKIESRPLVGRPWEYSFYLDFVGDRNDANVRRALAALAGAAESVRIFGSYPRAET
jgi:prephenate dehydratase